jgi:hypothetical protein
MIIFIAESDFVSSRAHVQDEDEESDADFGKADVPEESTSASSDDSIDYGSQDGTIAIYESFLLALSPAFVCVVVCSFFGICLFVSFVLLICRG